VIAAAVQALGTKAAAKAHRAAAVARYLAAPAYCQNCKAAIPVVDGVKPCATKKKRFCSRSCSASYHNSTNPKRVLQVKCRTCGTPVRSTHKFCSKECRDSARPEARAEGGRRVVAYRQRVKMRAVEAKGGKCERCGYSKSLYALTFHHRNPAEKGFSISGSSMSWAKVKAEIDKCDLLCHNCHAEVHEEVANSRIAQLEVASDC
jgi:predicted nucleic acid-binding Zn ribbon protein